MVAPEADSHYGAGDIEYSQIDANIVGERSHLSLNIGNAIMERDTEESKHLESARRSPINAGPHLSGLSVDNRH